MFAKMCHPLFERKHRVSNLVGVGMRDIAPHGERAASQPRHLSQCPATNRTHIFRVTKLVFEQCGKCG